MPNYLLKIIIVFPMSYILPNPKNFRPKKLYLPRTYMDTSSSCCLPTPK